MLNKIFSPLFIAILLLVSAQLGFFLYTPALPDIAGFFNVKISSMQLTLSVFILSYGVSQLIGGLFSDFINLKKLIIFFILVYLVSSYFCFVAKDYWIFLIMRGGQGLAAGGLSTLARVMMKTSYDDGQLLKNMATYSMASVLTPAVSPFIGGQIVHFSKWQNIFLFMTVYVFLLIFLVMFYYPIKNSIQATPSRNKNIFSIKSIFNNCVSVLSNKEFINFSINNVLVYFACTLEITYAPFILIKQYGLSESTYGTVMIIPAVSYFIGIFTLKKLNNYFKSEHLINIGLSIILISGVLFWIFTILDKPVVGLIVGCLSLTTLGAGFVLSPLAVKAYFSNKNPHIQGSAIAIYGSMQMLGASLLITLTSSFVGNYLNIFICSYILIPVTVFILMVIGRASAMKCI